MQERTLKQVAQAGLVLGFEWIARDGDESVWLYRDKPKRLNTIWVGLNPEQSLCKDIQITDYPDLPPEKSLLRLRDIVEGDDDR